MTNRIITVEEFADDLLGLINAQLDKLPDDKSRQQFLNALSSSFFTMPFGVEE